MSKEPIIQGTGDGGRPRLVGRKLLSFVIYVVLLTSFVKILTTAPETVIIQGMWMITYVGVFVVGGQGLIDTLVPIAMRWADAYATAKTGKASGSMEHTG